MDSLEPPGTEHVITRLLLDWRGGDLTAYEQLASLVYGELHRIARRQMSRERPEHTLQPSALVNEAFLRLIDYDQVNWQNRQHFFCLAAKMMREVLVNYAAARKTQKRGGSTQRITFDEAFVGDTKEYLTENLKVEVLYVEGKAASITLPSSVVLTVTESAEGVRGDSANNVQKPATLETGKIIQVPLFVKEGEKVKVSTENGAYMGRA